MSAMGARRSKERGVLPNSKAVTPFSEKSKVIVSTVSSVNRSSGREKPRSVSRGPVRSQKPAIRQVPRVDKQSAVIGGDLEARKRLSSTSSVPRGRSSSPFGFQQMSSDSRRARVSSVAVERVGRGNVFPNRSSDLEMSSVRVRNGKVLKESGLKASNRRVGSALKENRNPGTKLGKESVKLSADFTATDEESDLKSSLTDVNLSEETSGIADGCVLDDSNDQFRREEYSSSLSGDVHQVQSVRGPNVVARSHGVQKVRPSLSSNVNGLKVTGVSKEKEVNALSAGVRVGDKYPSRLHEKLAFLEGKVKRIASDIKRTKEILDMNNTVASKVKISDIQEKISGIEKAMSHVVGESDRSSGMSENMDTEDVENVNPDGEKILLKGQNSDELEARIFSHQKMLKTQSLLKMSSSDSQPDQCRIVLPNCGSRTADEIVSCPINENLLSFEYLASVNKGSSKISMHLCNGLDVSEVEETEDGSCTPTQQGSDGPSERNTAELQLTSNECLEEFDEQENKPVMVDEEDNDENASCQIRELGRKASTGGWFVSEGESVLLVHDDGSCSLHDVANSEVKSEYKPPSSIFSNIWSDCWVIRAPSADGCSGKYVVAASAGNTLESGFCSWDFYTKEVQAFHIEEETSNKRSILAPLHGSAVQRRSLSTMMSTENRQWWYKPLGPLIVSTASFQKSVQIFDIRDGERIMKWNVQKPVLNMDHSSPLQWRNRGKVVIAEADGISLWDVGSLNPTALLNVPASGHKISALHVNNTDAEGGGVRQRSSSSEAEGHDGVFCTADSINILDFREPSGVGLKIPTLGISTQSIFSRGDLVFLGCSTVRPPGKTHGSSSQVQQFSLRRQKLVNTYVLPESNAHIHHTSLNQVWGNADLVMGVSGQGLFVFDALKDEGLPSFALDYCGPQKAREVIGPDDLYTPTFDYASSQVLLISRDRPAMFRYI